MTDDGNRGLLSPKVIEERQGIHRRALNLDRGNPVPLLVAPYSHWYVTEDRLSNLAADLEGQLVMCEQQNRVPDHSIPHLKPGTGIGTIPAAFGCKWRPMLDADPWIKPIITSQNPQTVYELEIPDPSTSGHNTLFYERVAYFEEHSALPMESCNIPAPLTAASMIWEYSSFAMALLDHPKEVHHLLELVTEYTILWLRKEMADMKRLWSLSHMNWYIPLEYGLRVSDDVMAILSPRQYEEFGVPYNSRLAREFGGIVVHSCGNIVHNLASAMKTEGLRGIELALPENDIVKIQELAAGKTALMLRYWNVDWEGHTPPADLVVYTQDVLDTLGTQGIMLEMQVPSQTLEGAVELASRLQAQEWFS